MKTMKELNEQFDKEELIWKGRMEKLNTLVLKFIDDAKNNESFEERMSLYDLAIDVCKQMDRLDSEHKKFLLKWTRKFHKAILLNALFNRSEGE